MQLVLFDFDGTVTKKDSLWSFLIFARGRFSVFVSILVLFPVFALYGLRIINGGRLKEILLRWHFKGRQLSDLQRLATEFNSNILRAMLRPGIFNQLVAYKKSGAEVCIVTASCDLWIKPFCEENGCAYLATEMEFVNNKYSGKFRTPNCNRAEKSNRIRAAYDLSKFEKIIAYGNSDDDLAMFSLANEIHRV